MNSESHAAATLSRLLAADWEGRTSFAHSRTRAKLMQEYLRRTAWWARELDTTIEWPFFDIAARVAAEVSVPDDLAGRLEELISTRAGCSSTS